MAKFIFIPIPLAMAFFTTFPLLLQAMVPPRKDGAGDSSINTTISVNQECGSNLLKGFQRKISDVSSAISASFRKEGRPTKEEEEEANNALKVLVQFHERIVDPLLWECQRISEEKTLERLGEIMVNKLGIERGRHANVPPLVEIAKQLEETIEGLLEGKKDLLEEKDAEVLLEKNGKWSASVKRFGEQVQQLKTIIVNLNKRGVWLNQEALVGIVKELDNAFCHLKLQRLCETAAMLDTSIQRLKPLENVERICGHSSVAMVMQSASAIWCEIMTTAGAHFSLTLDIMEKFPQEKIDAIKGKARDIEQAQQSENVKKRVLKEHFKYAVFLLKNEVLANASLDEHNMEVRAFAYLDAARRIGKLSRKSGQERLVLALQIFAADLIIWAARDLQIALIGARWPTNDQLTQ